MNWDRIEGNWKQLRGKVQQQWGKLTDDDLTTIEGRRVELVGKIQERYGIAKDEAEKQVDSWIRNLKLTLGPPRLLRRGQPRRDSSLKPFSSMTEKPGHGQSCAFRCPTNPACYRP
jgi:uncharacterized protein YjbJ (UPF0337 family)